MKKLIAAIFTATVMFGATAANAATPPKTKVVCKDVKNKDGTVKKSCKTIKVHKKYQGTKVPTTPKKK